MVGCGVCLDERANRFPHGSMWVWKMEAKENYKVLSLASRTVVVNIIVMILQSVASCFIGLKRNSELALASLHPPQPCANDTHKVGAE